MKHLVKRVTLGTLAAILATSYAFPSTTLSPTPTNTPRPTPTPIHTPTLTYLPPTLVPTFTPTSTPMPIPSPVLTIPFDEQRVSELHYELLEIIKEIDPEVIGFGEIHTRDKINYSPSTTTVFAEYLLKPLQEQGFNDLIFEALSYNFPQERLEEYYYTKDFVGAALVLINSGEIGLNLYGSFITKEEYLALPDECWSETGLTSEECGVSEKISLHAAEKANELLALEKKVMLYGGLLHNDLVEEFVGQKICYMDDINTDSYLEVDLINPDLIYIFKLMEDEDYSFLIYLLMASGLEVNLMKGGLFRFSSENMNRVIMLYPCRFEDCESVLSLY